MRRPAVRGPQRAGGGAVGRVAVHLTTARGVRGPAAARGCVGWRRGPCAPSPAGAHRHRCVCMCMCVSVLTCFPPRTLDGGDTSVSRNVVQRIVSPEYRKFATAMWLCCGLCVRGLLRVQFVMFSLIRRSHSISFTRAQGIPKYKIGFGRGKGWESWGAIGGLECETSH
jgi:hypothetical protein